MCDKQGSLFQWRNPYPPAVSDSLVYNIEVTHLVVVELYCSPLNAKLIEAGEIPSGELFS